MNDPFTSAARSIGENLSKVVAGKNPLFAPSVADLFGFNIPGVPLVSARDYFLTQMESWVTSIPLTTQWIIVIERYPRCLTSSVIQGLERTKGDKKGFDIDKAVRTLTAYPLQKITGCIFAQGVNIDQEAVNVEYVNIENSRGFTPAPITTTRDYPKQLTIEFLETNTSFTDFVLRPWVIAASHFGFVARDPSIEREAIKNVKTNMTIMQFTRTFQGISMIPRKIWQFYDCCPIQVGSRSMGYDKEGFAQGRNYMETKWTFSNYTVESNFYFPLVSIINRISDGKLPDIFPKINKNLDIRGFF